MYKRIGYALCCLLLILACSVPGAGAAVRADLAGACLGCHPALKEGLSQKYVHFPFKQGKCGACHDMHVSDNKGLLKDDINTICLGCHADIRNMFGKTNLRLHTALRRGVCTSCHVAHSSDNKGLLVKPRNELCWTCHGKLKDQLGRADVHAPFKGGDCASCHEPHGSSENDHLIAAPNKLCKSCHTPRCKADNGVSIAAITKNSDCASCHTGHSSDTKGLLGPYGHPAFISKDCGQCHNPFVAGGAVTTKAAGEKLCFICHKNEPSKFRVDDVHMGEGKNACAICHSSHASTKKNLTVNESALCINCHTNTAKSTASMEKTLKGKECVPVKDRRCFECHAPLHSSRPSYLKADPMELCGKCHATEHKITHPLGKGIKDPRNGQMLTCVSCHSMHAARSEFMLTFDRKRQLCIQCHNK